NLHKIQKNYKKSIDYYQKASAVFLEVKDFMNLKQAYGGMSVVYEELNDYKQAMRFQQLYAQYTDSVFTQDNAKQLAEMQTKYDVEKKDLELAKNKAEIETKEKQSFIKNHHFHHCFICSVICCWNIIL
ncbi:MAG: tetratricopeptide repeat protein, partial [Bacteroidota bacterium]